MEIEQLAPAIKSPSVKIIKAESPTDKVYDEAEILDVTPYNPLIPRRLMEGLTGCSTNHLVKYEQEGVITPIKVRRGGLEVVSYRVSDVARILEKRGKSFKHKKSEAEIIAIFSQKGGVGKSACAQHLGSFLSLLGKTLIIDLDSQADLTNLVNAEQKHTEVIMDESELDPTIAELMDWTLANGEDAGYRQLPFDKVIKKLSPTLHIIPSSLDMGEINYSLNRLTLSKRTNSDGSEQNPPELYMIKNIIDQIKGDYDFILFDMAPNIETLNVATLLTANRVLIPLELEAKSILTIRRNESFLNRLKETGLGFNFDKILIVPQKYKKENIKIRAYSALMELYQDRTDIQLSSVTLPNSVIIDKCADAREPVFVSATKFGKEHKSTAQAGKEFTNYFWVIIHELLDIEGDSLVFPVGRTDGEI